MCFKGVVGGSFLEDIWGLARSQSDRGVDDEEKSPKWYSDEVGADDMPYLHDGVEGSREK